jgi:SAM-dependent methyltransferase
MHPRQDYESAVAQLRNLIAQRMPSAASILDIACGTGRHLSLLREHFDVEGLDINAEMLQIARRRCPGVVFHEADMRSFALHRQFDVVCCLFSSIGYVRTSGELTATLRNLRDHARPGGLVLVEPWLSPDMYRVGTLTMHTAVDGDTKVAWMYSAAVDGDQSVFDIHHLVGTGSGVEHFVERHALTLFTKEQYELAFAAAGLTPTWDRQGFFGYGLFAANRAAS